MHCPMLTNDGAEALLSYCSGKLDAAHSAMLERHLEECAECRALVDAQKNLWSTLDTWQQPAISAEFDRRLYARIAGEERTPSWQRMFAPTRWAFRPALPLTAACAVVVAVLLMRPVPAPEMNSQSRIEVVEIEQIEQALEDIEMLTQLTSTKQGDATRQL